MARKSRQQEQLKKLLPSPTDTVAEVSPTIYKTAIYARLSANNFATTNVDVLGSQLNHLKEYVASHSDMQLVDTYVDDGWSGINFNRPDFTRMMDDMKAGKINCIVVRDFSRFGRNYLETGYYLHEVFPAYNMRFISVFDEFDSLVSDADSMIFSMMQIVNDFYSKDISRKICSVYDAKVQKGSSWGKVPFGYYRRDDGTGRLLMDEKVCHIAYLIFYWGHQKTSPTDIADNLNLLGFSYSQSESNYLSRASSPVQSFWYHSAVRSVLTNPLYTGDYVYNRFRNRKYDAYPAYDSAISTNISDNMSMVLKSILNSYYSRDLSAKMYSFNTQRMKNGEFVGSPCFGYILNPEKTHFIIDPDAARIVRRIFDLALSGKPRSEIVTILNNEGHLTPAEYNRQHGYAKSQMVTSHPIWDHVKVSKILREEAYTGKLIMRKRVQVAPCSKKKRPAEPSEQFIRENAHEAIVTKEEFERIQIMMPKRKGWNRENQRQYALKGVVRCGTCGKVMSHRAYPKPGALQCPESVLEHSICPSRLFPLSDVQQAVLLAIKPFLQIIIQTEKKFNRKQLADRSSRHQKNIAELQQQKKQLQQQKTQLYEDYVSDQISLDEYLAQKSKFNEAGQSIEKKISELEAHENSLNTFAIPLDLQQAAESARQYADTDTLSPELVHSFIEDVYLHETYIEICWKFKDLFEQFMQENNLTNIIQTENTTSQEETL